MYTYFDTKTNTWNNQKTLSVSKHKVLISKKILDEKTVRTFVNGSNDKVYVADVCGAIFSYVKVEEILIPEYNNGKYRVSFGTTWDPDFEEFVDD